MNEAGELLAFAGLMALCQLSPGPDMVLLTQTAVRERFHAGLKMAMGIACGLTVHATVAVAGQAALLERFPNLRRVLIGGSAIYLLWLSWGIFQGVRKTRRPSSLPQRTGSAFLRGFFCNLLNPKAAIFLASVSTPFLRGERPDYWPLALWGIIVGQGAIIWSVWVGLLQWRLVRTGYDRCSGWIDMGVALALLALSIQLIRSL